MEKPEPDERFLSHTSEKIDRRSFLKKTTYTLSGVRLLGTVPLLSKANVLSEYPFTLGVASGEPLPDGIVLWTRLAPRPLVGGGMPEQDFEVNWELALDPEFQQAVQTGKQTAPAFYAHSVHVAVNKLLPNQQ